MLGLGSDREVFRDRIQRRLRIAGAHAARPRHPRRVRAAQERNRKAQRPRANGAARHGDDGLAMVVGRLLMRLLLVPFGGGVAICVATLFAMVAQWNRMAALTADDYSGVTTFFVMVPVLAVGSGVMLWPATLGALLA